jgi:hypothetical protein
MSRSAAGAASSRAKWSLAWPRFPSNWIVARRGTEGFFSKAIWFVLPIQYYVLNRFPGGLNDAYVASAMVALMSIASLFAASCIFALVHYRRPEKAFDSALKEPGGFGRRYALGVRMWAIALIVTWAMVHVVLALSYLVGGGRGDVVHWYACVLQTGGCQKTHPDFSWLTVLEYAFYATVAVGILALARFLHLKWTRAAHKSSEAPEPNLIVVILTVSGLMTLINGATTWPHSAPPGILLPTAGAYLAAEPPQQ